MSAADEPVSEEVALAQQALDAATEALALASRKRLPNRELVEARRKLHEAEERLAEARRRLAEHARQEAGVRLRPDEPSRPRRIPKR